MGDAICEAENSKSGIVEGGPDSGVYAFEWMPLFMEVVGDEALAGAGEASRSAAGSMCKPSELSRSGMTEKEENVPAMSTSIAIAIWELLVPGSSSTVGFCFLRCLPRSVPLSLRSLRFLLTTARDAPVMEDTVAMCGPSPGGGVGTDALSESPPSPSTWTSPSPANSGSNDADSAECFHRYVCEPGVAFAEVCALGLVLAVLSTVIIRSFNHA